MMRAEFDQLINTLGVPAVLTRAKPPATVTNIQRVGFASISKQDQGLVNAYGLSGKVITVKAADCAGVAPLKFDVFMVGTERYVADTVNPLHEPGVGSVIGYKVYCKGHV